MIVVVVDKTGSESNASLLRRFSKRVKGVGHLQLARTIRYSTRTKSALKKKQDKLKRIAKFHTLQTLRKEGKIKDAFQR
ncbi:MAG: hypothetical protein A2571_02005 [Candidatus Vogelbacteria bacterium RIFOXYD1_FULL_44_32]|uniref:30S ribosomal protein S21 n=1 Tax=Candidatus Vogelbacteria bacterium RIFOXYD1_FULL_44_32 TaxID=1802438 RepID=A0A1G2QDE9_9BACT|nr:MAG: hypothetical protein A2571_02005 [Candidatus Vogelbacteria bacterium RIFOXYD1_FULL_44_32]